MILEQLQKPREKEALYREVFKLWHKNNIVAFRRYETGSLNGPGGQGQPRGLRGFKIKEVQEV